MVSQAGPTAVRTSMSMNLQFTRGRHGAAARLEVHERPAGRVGLMALRGWVDLSAARGIECALADLAERGVSRLVVDCSQLLHVDYRLVPRLAEAMLRFEAHAGAVVLCGLSRYLRDLFRISGCESKLCCWPSAADLLDAAAPEACAPGVPPAAPVTTARERERAS
jgi:anti-anti-sigma regulatory factor